jgi:hypothetical protein
MFDRLLLSDGVSFLLLSDGMDLLLLSTISPVAARRRILLLSGAR